VLKLAIKGLRNKDVGIDLNISVRTVEGHFNSIFNKLAVSSKIEAVLLGIAFWHNTSVEN
jgi:DNA-binding NarL/FixJ family response regulator